MDAKRVLVTGSSRGIGKQIAVRLAEDGWSVAVHSTAESEGLWKMRSVLGKSCSGVYAADLKDAKVCKHLVERALRDGPLHALVNNAGVYMPLDFLGSSDAVFLANLHKTLAVNLESPIRLTRAACKHFKAAGGGKVLNVASRVGFRGEAGAAHYAATKAALINLTRSLAVELAPAGIQFYGIAPGWVDTAMAREGMPGRLDEILATIPLGRMATAGDCASVAAFLLSEQADYLSGVVIDINGASYFH